MAIKHFCIYFILILITIPLFTQEIVVKQNTIFENEFIDRSPRLNSIEQVDFNFKGYLVIKIKDNQFYKDSSIYNTKIYWINSLDDFNNEEQYYWYHSQYIFWLNECCQNQHSCPEVVKKFVELFTTINKYSRKVYNTYLYTGEDGVTTNILDTTKLWSKDGENYIIIEAEFIASVVNVMNSRNPTGSKEPYRYKTLIPISRLLYFKEIDKGEADKYQFMKSNYKVKLR